MTSRVVGNEGIPSDLVDAPRNIEARNAQEELWAQTNVDARQNLHMREAALRYKNRFQLAMDWYEIVKCIVNSDETSFFYLLHPGLLQLVVSFAFSQQHQDLVFALFQQKQIYSKTQEQKENNKTAFKIFVRPRPLLQFEIKSDEYKVVSTNEGSNVVQLHDGRMDRTGRRLNMRHFEFSYDKVFPAQSTNDAVCMETIAKLFDHACIEKKNSTLIFYGQTGTGKTFTMNACIKWLCSKIYNYNSNNSENIDEKSEQKGDNNNINDEQKPHEGSVKPTNNNGKVKKMITPSINFFEIHGSKAYDLLQNRKIIKLLSDREGKVHPRGSKTIHLENAPKDKTTMLKILKQALALRSIEVTERNPISSRS
jgi:hypothetical protein